MVFLPLDTGKLWLSACFLCMSCYCSILGVCVRGLLFVLINQISKDDIWWAEGPPWGNSISIGAAL